MATIRVTLSGLDRLEKRLAQDMARREIKVNQAIADEGRHTQTNARRRARKKTGRLRAGILLGTAWLQATVRSTVFYGFFLEYGTRTMRPYPFMHPTFLTRSRVLIKTLKRIS